MKIGTSCRLAPTLDNRGGSQQFANLVTYYQAKAKAFQEFCLANGISLPLSSGTEYTLMCFAAHCAHTMKLAASTINTCLYGIRDWHLGGGQPDPLWNTYVIH